MEPRFTDRVMKTKFSFRFKLSTQLETYEGKTDPIDHLDLYKSLMSLQEYSNKVICKVFSTTLKGSARSWFRKLSQGTIDSFGDLSRLLSSIYELSSQVEECLSPLHYLPKGN